MGTILIVTGLILAAILVLAFVIPTDPKEEERLSNSKAGADSM